ncbi:MAG TPA: TylF/MycF/NovP-related O-methyltransferase [Terracidiphilus sp.]|nr:TylF/MycF/NovP-related O-methyltransferase [Terracidiphilus sp.]
MIGDRVAELARLVRRKTASPQTLNALPPVPDMQRVFEDGRCLYDGYQRGALAKYGELGEMVRRDPAYRKARKAAQFPAVESMVIEDRFINLFLLIKFFLRDLASQNIIEFGAFKGGSAVFMATLLKEFYPRARMLSLDTFAGLGELETGVDKPPEDFLNVNFERTCAAARTLGLDNLEFVKGFIEDTGLEACRTLGTIGLAHIDVVLHGPSVFAQNLVWDFMAPDGYLVQDDALEPTCPGATMAVEEMIRTRGLSMEQVWPQIIFRAHRPA